MEVPPRYTPPSQVFRVLAGVFVIGFFIGPAVATGTESVLFFEESLFGPFEGDDSGGSRFPFGESSSDSQSPFFGPPTSMIPAVPDSHLADRPQDLKSRSPVR